MISRSATLCTQARKPECISRSVTLGSEDSQPECIVISRSATDNEMSLTSVLHPTE